MERIPYKWLVAVVFVAAVFMDLLDTSIVNVAIPRLSHEFDASVSQVQWAVLGYLLALAISIPSSGWFGDRYGTKRVFLLALGAFTLASMLCGTASSLTQLTGFRFVQGFGGGMMVPVGTAMLYRAFPPIERARASTILTIPVGLAPMLGPLIGGWLVTDFSWRWIFFINIPMGLLAFVVGAIGLREHKEPAAGRFDVAGFLLAGAGLAGILFALSRGPIEGWGSLSVLIPGVLGIIAFATLVWVETKVVQTPMLALRLLGERMFRRVNLVATLSFASFIGLLFLMPLFLQELLGLSALESGLVLFPQAIGMMLTGQICGRVYHSVGPRRLLVCGLAAMSIVTLSLVTVDFNTSLWVIRAIMFIRGMTLGFVLIPIQTAVYANVQRSDTGRATAIFSAGRQIAGSLGVAVLSTVLVESINHFSKGASNHAQLRHASLNAFHFSFFIGSCMIMIAAFSALMIRDTDAASTMRGRAAKRVEPEPTPAVQSDIGN